MDMETENLKEKIREQVSQGKLESALKLLISFDRTYAKALTFRYNNNQKRFNAGIAESEEFNKEKNNICNAILLKLENEDFGLVAEIDKLDNFNCPECGNPPEEEQLSSVEIKCRNCSWNYFIYRPLTNTTSFRSLSPEESTTYRRLLFRIEAEFELEDYKKVDELCQQAIELASRESIAWEYQALSFFFNNSRNSIIEDELNTIKRYFKISDRANPNSHTFSMMSGRIIYHLNFSIKHRIKKYWKSVDEAKSRKKLQKLIKSWLSCYEISGDHYFLGEIVKTLGREGRLIKRNAKDELSNRYDDFDALRIWSYCINTLKKKDATYTPPLIEYQDGIARLKSAGYKYIKMLLGFLKTFIKYVYNLIKRQLSPK